MLPVLFETEMKFILIRLFFMNISSKSDFVQCFLNLKKKNNIAGLNISDFVSRRTGNMVVQW